MPIITITQWREAISGVNTFRRTPLLTTLTETFDQMTHAALKSIKALEAEKAYKAWTASPTTNAERTTIGATPIANLLETINAAKGGTAVRASNVQAIGWTLKAWTPLEYSWTTATQPNDSLPNLTPSEYQRVNESVARAKLAAEIGRDAMLKLQGKTAFSNPLTPAERHFKDYFGTLASVPAVLQRFKILALALTNSPVFVDLRNTEYGKTCYAACFRKNLTSGGGGTGLTLTGKAEIFLGRAFFGKGGYSTSTDTTVGTLIHEFSHGAWNAVDVPRTHPDGSWELQPDTTPGDDEWETPDNSNQSSTPELGKRLAQYHPLASIVNADSYGQFAKETILHASK